MSWLLDHIREKHLKNIFTCEHTISESNAEKINTWKKFLTNKILITKFSRYVLARKSPR